MEDFLKVMTTMEAQRALRNMEKIICVNPFNPCLRGKSLKF